MREALRRAEAAQDHRNYVAAALNLADTLVATDPRASVEVARMAVAQGKRVGNMFLVPTAVSNLVQGLLLTGEWDEAERELQASLDADNVHSMIAYGLVQVRGLRGETDSLDELLAHISENAKPEDAQFSASLWTSEAMVAMAKGDHEVALAAASRTLALTSQLACSHEVIRWSWPIAVEMNLALGDMAEASSWLAWVDQFPVGHLADVQVLERGRLHAKLLAAKADPAAGAEFEAAVAAMRAWVSPYHLALALLDQAEHLAAAGEPDRAVAAADEAREIGKRLRCQPVLNRSMAIAPAHMPEQDVKVPADVS
jgi:tetratricopeptide (TPR) repeat protein